MEYNFLNRISSPDDLKKLNNDELNSLCAEIRECVLDTVSKNGGHLAANLGTVELTVALHKSFDSPKDAIIFDVGHQCYTHKLLTGRFELFSTLRKENGISGFMRPSESEHDYFVTGHSSTSVSSALGVCEANRFLNDNGYSIAVIGDGALTGGLAFESFNNISKKNKKLIVILNDNKMSISKNRNALSKHLGKIRLRPNYFKFKSSVERFLIKIPLVGRHLRNFVFRIKNMLKNAIYDSNIFESLGLYYMGPIDGHDIDALTQIFSVARELDRPILIHVKTVKGKGYTFAEENPDVYHGVSGFDIKSSVTASEKPDFSKIFGQELCKIAESDNKVCAITAAMKIGTGLKSFSEQYKERFFDVGIAEQHAITFSAGLAKKGLKPVFAVYSTFLQRGYDQILHDAAIARLPLTLAVDRAGFVGDDGETHQGLFDVSFLSSIPGVTIYSPSNYDELRFVLKNRLNDPKGVAAIRYPRGFEPVSNISFDYKNEFSLIGEGSSAIVTYGTLVYDCINAANILNNENINISVVKLNVINDLSKELIDKLLTFKNIVFFEEGILNGGIAERLGFKLLINGYKGSYKAKAVEGFVAQAKVDIQKKKYGLDTDSIVKEIKEVISVG